MNDNNNLNNWEKSVLEKLVFETLKEQRLKRRWQIFFRLCFFLLVFFIIFSITNMESANNKKNTNAAASSDDEHVAMIAVNGVISADSEANAKDINAALNAAFEEKTSKAILLQINSPGGSPVQSDLIFSEIMRLRKKFPDKPLYAVILDSGTSGAYYIASAAEKIYANPSSIVGSIGVIMDGFGFEELIKKIGVERRAFHAGENKAFLDSFSPINEEQKNHVQNLLNDVHKNFINAVKAGRGNKLKNPEENQIFSGLFWTGSQSINLGLIDGFGSVESVSRDVFKTENIQDYSVEESIESKFAKKLGLISKNILLKFSTEIK